MAKPMGALATDKEVVLTAVKQDGFALEYASKELQNDKKVVLTAVNKDGLALKYASYELKNNKEIVLDAVTQNAYSLQFASKELQNDDKIIQTFIDYKITNWGLKRLIEENEHKLITNKKILLAFIKKNHNEFNLINNKFKINMNFVIQAFLINPKININNNFRYNDEFWIKIIKQNKSYINYLPEYLKKDEQFISLFN